MLLLGPVKALIPDFVHGVAVWFSKNSPQIDANHRESA
jgi:hypothetical protein